MSKITAEQKAALKAAGYTVSKSGNTVLNAKGATVAGYNEKGNLFSGSSKISSILKSKPSAPAPKPAAKAPAKAAPKPTAKKPSKSPVKAPAKATPITVTKLGKAPRAVADIRSTVGKAIDRAAPKAAAKKAPTTPAGRWAARHPRLMNDPTAIMDAVNPVTRLIKKALLPK